MIVGEKIKSERIKRGLSQEELGNMLGVTKVSICGYEKGTRNPTLEVFERIINVLELEPDVLLGKTTSIIGEQEEPYHFKISDQELVLIRTIRNHKEFSNQVYQQLKNVKEKSK